MLFTRNPRSYTLSQMYPHVLVSNQSYSYSNLGGISDASYRHLCQEFRSLSHKMISICSFSVPFGSFFPGYVSLFSLTNLQASSHRPPCLTDPALSHNVFSRPNLFVHVTDSTDSQLPFPIYIRNHSSGGTVVTGTYVSGKHSQASVSFTL